MAKPASYREKGHPKVKNSAYILALDVGTTSVRAHIYNQAAQILTESSRKIVLSHPQPGYVEMDEELLWQQVQDVIKEAIASINLSASDVTCLGITCQRNTFITWDRETGEPFHHFITWQDLRACDTVKKWNDSYTMSALNKGSRVAYTVTRKMRFLAAAVLRFKSGQVTMRLLWQLQNNEKLRQRVAEKQVMYGAIDTWLLWKLTDRQVFATDYSSASSTGFYDPFNMEWSPIVSGLVGIPLHMMPQTRDTSGDFGKTDSSIFGAEIPITAMVADQQSAMFGQCCFEVGDVKCTMGTGTFIDCNTGSKPHASIAGLYPLVGWKIGSELVFVAEGFSSDTGQCVEWAKSLGLFEDVSQLSDIAQSVPDSAGAYFVPAFNGLQAPLNDDKACASFMGLTPGASKPHLLRAILESLAFRFKLLHETVLSETKTPLARLIKCDGGVCNNDFLVQLVADLTGRQIDRPETMDMTSLGAAFLAGLSAGVWQSKDELKKVRRTQRVFQPRQEVRNGYTEALKEWNKAVKRSRDWYKVARV